METITASIVVPTYRRPKYLINCLEALLAQTFDKQRFEVLVISDGPDEETKILTESRAVEKYPSLRYLSLPEKKGPAAARNLGWLNARGGIIAFTDDDCIPDTNWLKEIIKHCHPSPNAAITGKVIVPIGKRPTDFEQNTANLQTADFITANCACTKNALLKAGGFDERFSMAWREDSDLEFSLMSINIPIKKVDSAIVVHPVRNAAWGISIREQKKTIFNALLYKKHPDLYRKKIRQITPMLYYGIIAGMITMLTGITAGQPELTAMGCAAWLSLTIYFILKRLYHTQLSAIHIIEMIVTSFVIPFLSVYWQWYGAIKYRILFI